MDSVLKPSNCIIGLVRQRLTSILNIVYVIVIPFIEDMSDLLISYLSAIY